MTLKGHQQLPKDARRLMARCMQIHLLTHPQAVGARFGVTSKYVQEQWREMADDEFAPLREALSLLFGEVA
jgi:hypothetical protein